MYVLIWHSQYGKEEIDECDSLEEAHTLQAEYQMAYGGIVTLKKVAGQIKEKVCAGR